MRAMQVQDLNAAEDVALLGLLREVVQADGVFTDIEQAEVARIRDAIGETRFNAAIHVVQDRFASRGELKEYLKTIERPGARRVIYDILIEVAASDGVDPSEEAPLRWLKSWWDL